MKRTITTTVVSALALMGLLVPQGTAQATTACPTPTTTVSTSTALEAALTSANPGDVIQMADGTYDGTTASAGWWKTTRSGTAAQPIWLCGGPNAILVNGGITSNYGLHLDGVSYWHLLGFTVTSSQKGVMVDASNHVTVEGLTIHGVGDEGIHLRKNTTDSLVTENDVSDTGNRREKFGEGIYIGSADSNWSLTGGLPDASDNNVISYNNVHDTPAESVDIKEGTQNGKVIGNTFDGSGQTSEGGDSWVDAKGNNWVIAGNVGAHSLKDGFTTHHKNRTKDGLGNWGLNNYFGPTTYNGVSILGNTADVQGPGYGFWFHDPTTTGNIVVCSPGNTVTSAVLGFSNKACTP